MNENFQIKLNDMDRLVIKDALDFHLQELEDIRKSFKSPAMVANSGIMHEINACKKALKTVKQNLEPDTHDFAAMGISLISFIDFFEIAIKTMPESEHDDLIDTYNAANYTFKKFQPFISSLDES